MGRRRAAVCEHMGDLEGKGADCLVEEGDRAPFGFVVLDRQMDEPGRAVDSDREVSLTALAICRAQLGQVLHVQVDEAEIIGLERAVRARPAWSWQAAQALGFQDAVDRVAVEMRQEVGDHEGQVIQGKAGRTP